MTPSQDRRKPPPIQMLKSAQVLKSAPPSKESRLHTINFKDRKGSEETWLANKGISIGYIQEENGMYLLSYYECDKLN